MGRLRKRIEEFFQRPVRRQRKNREVLYPFAVGLIGMTPVTDGQKIQDEICKKTSNKQKVTNTIKNSTNCG